MGLYDNSGIAAQMFEALYDEGIEIKLISTSETKILAVIESKSTEIAYRAI